MLRMILGVVLEEEDGDDKTSNRCQSMLYIVNGKVIAKCGNGRARVTAF